MTQDLERNDGGLPVRELGKTGLKVSIVGFGGAHAARPSIEEQTTVRLIQMAIDAGMTFREMVLIFMIMASMIFFLFHFTCQY